MPTYNFYQIVAKDAKGVEATPCYIGATRSPLHKRFYEHKKAGQTCSSHLLLKEFGAENCSIRLLRSTECDPQEAKRVERQYIEEYRERAVNLRIPSRTSKERYELNRDGVLQHMKEYYQGHKTRIKARCLTYYYQNKKVVQEKTHRLVQCPDCDKTLKYMSLSTHRKKACPKQREEQPKEELTLTDNN